MGHTDPALTDAFRVTARAVKRAQAVDEFLADTAASVRRLLATKPFEQIDSNWAYGAKTAPAASEFAAWLQQQDDPDGCIAESVFLPASRDQLIRRFAADYADAMARIAEREGRDWLEVQA